jgi:hypothetical protein
MAPLAALSSPDSPVPLAGMEHRAGFEASCDRFPRERGEIHGPGTALRPVGHARLGSRRSSGDGIVLCSDGPGYGITITHTHPGADADADPEPRAVSDTERDTNAESSTDPAALS